MTNGKDYFDAYTLAGYTLFPLNADKTPKVKGWRYTVFDPLFCAENGGSYYGVVLGEDDLILDVDTRRYASNENQLEKLIEIVGDLPDTFTVHTPSGGCHIYFKKPATTRVRAVVPGLPAIEVKRAGQYVGASGSPNYSTTTGDPANVAQCPDALLALITENAANEAAGVESDDLSIQERFVYYLATVEPALEGALGDLTTFRTACIGKDFGLPNYVTLRLMWEHYNPRCQPPWKYAELKEKVANAYNYASNQTGHVNPLADFDGVEYDTEPEPAISFQTDRQGVLKSNLTNCVNLFRVPENPLRNLIRYNAFDDRIEFLKQAPWHHGEDKTYWSDIDTISLKMYLTEHRHVEPSTAVCYEAAQIIAHNSAYHPVRDWLNTLVWDGINRVENLFTRYAGAKHNINYTREVARVLLIGAVARVFQPGCQYDYMVVLEGRQGAGKTNFVRTLGGDWYADLHHIDPDSKDLVCNMVGTWIAEASEMKFTKQDDVLALKSFITRTADKVRLPYARTSTVLPRQTVFIGTINTDATGEYLKDQTGNRRFLPVNCSRFANAALKEDRNQIFAEAVARYKSGENWRLSPEMEMEAENEQKTRMLADTWVEAIDDWLSEYASPQHITTDMVACQALGITSPKMGRIEQVRLAEAMKICGYARKKLWEPSKKKTVNVWIKLEIDPLDGLM